MKTPSQYVNTLTAEVISVGIIGDGRDAFHVEPSCTFDPTTLDKFEDLKREGACESESELYERAYREGRASVVVPLAAYILDGTNSKIVAYAIATAANLPVLYGKSMAKLAERTGLTRAALSKRANQAIDALKLPRSRNLRTTEVRETYRKRAKKIHRNSVNQLLQAHEQRPDHNQCNPAGTPPRNTDSRKPDFRGRNNRG